MTALLWMVGVFAAAGLVVWAACAFDDWIKGRPGHADCQLCHEPMSRLDVADRPGVDPWQP